MQSFHRIITISYHTFKWLFVRFKVRFIVTNECLLNISEEKTRLVSALVFLFRSRVTRIRIIALLVIREVVVFFHMSLKVLFINITRATIRYFANPFTSQWRLIWKKQNLRNSLIISKWLQIQYLLSILLLALILDLLLIFWEKICVLLVW